MGRPRTRWEGAAAEAAQVVVGVVMAGWGLDPAVRGRVVEGLAVEDSGGRGPGAVLVRVPGSAEVLVPVGQCFQGLGPRAERQ